MKAVILAAGLGSRISELTNSIPKAMIKISDKYIFQIIIDSLIIIGIDELIIIVGYKSELLIQSVNKLYNNKNLKISFINNQEYASTNTMYSLWLARKELESPFVFFHGDLIFSYKMLVSFIDSNYPNAVLVDKRFPLDWDDAMKIIEHDNELQYMSKQITLNEMDGIAIGIYKFDANGSKKLFEVISALIEKKVYSSWVSEAINILSKHISIGIDYNKDNYAWTDVDNLKGLEMGNKIYKEISK